MNPFRIKREELNVEKIGFLKNLIMLIWKGTQGTVTKTEDRLIEQVITEYYDVFFNGFDGFTPPQREDLRKGLLIDDRNKNINKDESDAERLQRIELLIDDIERRRKELPVKELSFNSFYEFSVQRIPDICNENQISGIDISTYRYMMKDFYRGGNHEKTLNEDLDSTLFDETFIVFEIDSIKDDPLLFPLVTLIIMDVFIQKMRIKKNRKVLVIEEAWKAIASPMMAEYIKYLYKTARKFWASVGVVTQEIQDIVGSPIVKEAIINNSDVVMLLDQSKFRERFDEIKSILGLTDVDCKKIFTICDKSRKKTTTALVQ
jgi:type IV secretory pathway VirB4 component